MYHADAWLARVYTTTDAGLPPASSPAYLTVTP
jgi:hypothetical protein